MKSLLRISRLARTFSTARWTLETLTMLEGLQEPARVQQVLDGSRLLPVPQEPPVCCGPFSTAFVQPAVFAAAVLSLRSICLLRSFSTAFPQVLGATTRSFQSSSIGTAITGK